MSSEPDLVPADALRAVARSLLAESSRSLEQLTEMVDRLEQRQLHSVAAVVADARQAQHKEHERLASVFYASADGLLAAIASFRASSDRWMERLRRACEEHLELNHFWHQLTAAQVCRICGSTNLDGALGVYAGHTGCSNEEQQAYLLLTDDVTAPLQSGRLLSGPFSIVRVAVICADCAARQSRERLSQQLAKEVFPNMSVICGRLPSPTAG